MEPRLFSWIYFIDAVLMFPRLLTHYGGADIKCLEINIQLVLGHTFRDHFFKVERKDILKYLVGVRDVKELEAIEYKRRLIMLNKGVGEDKNTKK